MRIALVAALLVAGDHHATTLSRHQAAMSLKVRVESSRPGQIRIFGQKKSDY